MPADGIVMRNVYHELNNILIGARIERITQPEREEVILQLHHAGKKYKLLLSANASAARIHLTDSARENPATPPNFCILLRKYLQGGRIVGLHQEGLERILEINVESANDIGDITLKTLVIEVMGKHSNMMLLNHNRKILDALKHVDFSTSRLREVLPGRDYEYPATQDKMDIMTVTAEKIDETFKGIENAEEIQKKLVDSFTGISPFFAKTILPQSHKDYLSSLFREIEGLKSNHFEPCLIQDEQGKYVDFHSFVPTNGLKYKKVDSISTALELYFSSKFASNKLGQKRAELIKIVSQELQRLNKKISFQEQKLKDVQDRENLKIFGELITANLYRIQEGDEKVIVNNYYTENNEEVTIPLDPNRSPSKNAQQFYKKYQKAKNTFEAVTVQMEATTKERDYLDAVLCQLELAEAENDIVEIREELINQGIIKTQEKSKKQNAPSMPHHFVSSDGFDIYVGRNNVQNDRLTLKQASNSDIWLHTQKIHGSHVIIKTEKKEVPDSTLVQAASLAAYFSKARMSSHVPVDYTFVRNVKKPSGAKPGFVIYENFKTVFVEPEKLTER